MINMPKHNRYLHHLPATSIIELMVSAALIGMVLTALTLNMARTQRTLENTFLRSKATDMANSCMNYFRAARDNNEWPIFCDRVKNVTVNSTGSPLGGNINASSSILNPICPQGAYAGSNFYLNLARSGRSGCSNIECFCKGNRDEAYFNLQVIVHYQDAIGVDKSVTVTERFSRGQLDAEYK